MCNGTNWILDIPSSIDDNFLVQISLMNNDTIIGIGQGWTVADISDTLIDNINTSSNGFSASLITTDKSPISICSPSCKYTNLSLGVDIINSAVSRYSYRYSADTPNYLYDARFPSNMSITLHINSITHTVTATVYNTIDELVVALNTLLIDGFGITDDTFYYTLGLDGYYTIYIDSRTHIYQDLFLRMDGSNTFTPIVTSAFDTTTITLKGPFNTCSEELVILQCNTATKVNETLKRMKSGTSDECKLTNLQLINVIEEIFFCLNTNDGITNDEVEQANLIVKQLLNNSNCK